MRIFTFLLLIIFFNSYAQTNLEKSRIVLCQAEEKYNNENYKEALQLFETAVNYGHGDEFMIFEMGMSNFYLGQYAEAIKLFTICEQKIDTTILKPDKGGGVKSKGFFRLWRCEQNKYLEDGLYLKEEMRFLYYYRGVSKCQLEDFKGAVTDFNQFVRWAYGQKEKLNDFPSVYYNRAYCYGRLHKYNSSLKDINMYISLVKKDPQGYFMRGIAEQQLNLKEKACQDLRKAGEMGIEKAYEIIKDYCQ